MPKRSILHDELVRRSEVLLHEIHNLWDGEQFQDVLFTWAGMEIKDDKGLPINDLVGCDLPKDGGHHSITLKMAIRTEACGILRIRRESEDVVKAIMETVHGSKSWTFPLDLRGDRRVLGSPTVKEDEDSIGVLWKKGMGQG